MTLHVGMIADDLTGALDAAAPFAERGLRTRVVLAHADWDAAATADAEVLCINTASREIAADEAAHRVAIATTKLAAFKPTLLFKKVDSRLKGHLGLELGAMLRASGRTTITLAPAIPDLGRFVIHGSVRGIGIDEPIDANALCGGLPVLVPDAQDNAAMDLIADSISAAPDTILAAGARGLAMALARRFPIRGHAPAVHTLAQPLLICIGSRDVITKAQVDHLMHQVSPLHLSSPNGAVPDARPAPIALVTVDQADGIESGIVVANRFAQGLVRLVRQQRPASMLLCGGETAFAVLTRLGVQTLDLSGEALPGVPFANALIDGRQVVILTKSGGFGSPDTISLLAGMPAELDCTLEESRL